MADAAYLGAGDRDLDAAVMRDLLHKVLVEARFKFADLATADARDVNVVARAVGFVIVAIAAEVKEIEFVDKSVFLEQIDGAVDGDEVDFGIDFLRAVEDLVDVQMLLGGVHDLEDDAALAGETNAALAKSLLELAAVSGRSVNAFASGDAMGGRGRHRDILGALARHG